jgi:hypothetical protein
VREVARGDKEARFTALLHHVDLDRLRAAYWAVRRQAAPGVDGVTWRAYGQELEANLADLHGRVHSGRYQARPSRRAYLVGEVERYGNIYRLCYVRGSEGSSWSWPSGSAESHGGQAGRGGHRRLPDGR